MPASYGLGLAWQWSDAFTVSLDAYRTQWSDFVLKTETGDKVSPITGGGDRR